METKEMIEGIRKGVGAIILSIEKWEDIAYKNGKESGRDNCALCWVFREGECNECPVRRVSGHRQCSNTPYDNWSYHKNTEHLVSDGKAMCNECLHIALEEIDFLTRVRFYVCKERQA